MLELIILANLMLSPCHGYEIKKVLKGMKINNNTLYPLLKKLEIAGLVSMEIQLQENKPPKKVYSITDAGKKKLFELINDFDEIKAAFNDEFYLRVAFLQFLEHEEIANILSAREKALNKISNKNRIMNVIDKFPDNASDLSSLHNFVNSQYSAEKQFVKSLKQKYNVK